MDETKVRQEYAESHGFPTVIVSKTGRVFVNPETGQRMTDAEISKSSHYQGWRWAAYRISLDEDVDKGKAMQGVHSYLDEDPVKDIW